MIGKIANLFKPDVNKAFLKSTNSLLVKINSFDEKFSQMSDLEIKNESEKLKNEIKNGVKIKDALPLAFALVREAGKRTLGMRHFDVQMIGGIALSEGNIAEMKTGEGKTFMCTLPAYLNSLDKKGVHIVSVNDYLTKRDCNWMRPVYEFLGVSVGCVTDEITHDEKIENYAKDIVYVNNSTLGFDYLRDNMRRSGEKSFFHNARFNYAIVDEADSILIDEARTPLIISGPSEQNSNMYIAIDKMVKKLEKNCYEVVEDEKTVHLTDVGVDKIEVELKQTGVISDHLYSIENQKIVNHIIQALKANIIFIRNKEYLVKDKKIMIIDELTGRILDGRRYSDGLHQAIEAKEGVEIQKENQTLASITYQNLFRMYAKISGMTGTAKTEEKEFLDIYHVKVIEIPTNKPIARKDLDDQVFINIEDKNSAIVEKVKDLVAKGQPVLIGTASVEYSEALSKIFTKNGIKHQVLNAKNHQKEAKIIANAGKLGAVTIATNMAGRGTDIKLGGSLETELEFFCEKSRTQDEIDKKTQELKEKTEKEREEVLKAGGLFVLGAERYESRRVDNQLRGRSGRQGDVGVSEFMLSLDDDLLRIFGGDRVKNLVSRLGFKKGESLNHPMLTRVIRYSQKRIEAMNYDMRKSVVRYDDILNQQRLYVYDRRNSIMENENISDNMELLCEDCILDIVQDLSLQNSLELFKNEAFVFEIKDKFGIDIQDKAIFEEKDFISLESSQKSFAKIVNDKINEDIIEHGFEIVSSIVKNVMLSTIDQAWREHLSLMSSVRDGIHLRSYGQKDPLHEYRMESYKHYDSMIKIVNFLTIRRIFSFEIKDAS